MTIVIEDPYGLAKPPPAEKVTYEQFLEWLDENTFAEWVDGEVVPMSAASAQHQDISGFLGALLRLYAETLRTCRSECYAALLKTPTGVEG